MSEFADFDYSKALSVEQIEKVKKSFRSVPTFVDGPDGGYMLTTDLPVHMERINYTTTPEQFVIYKDYYEKNYGGRVPFSLCDGSLDKLHDTAELAKVLATDLDTNKDGFISADEFEGIIKVLMAYDPKLKGTSFDQFVAEADTNNDQLVSADECAAWIKKCLDEAKS